MGGEEEKTDGKEIKQLIHRLPQTCYAMLTPGDIEHQAMGQYKKHGVVKKADLGPENWCSSPSPTLLCDVGMPLCFPVPVSLPHPCLFRLQALWGRENAFVQHLAQ